MSGRKKPQSSTDEPVDAEFKPVDSEADTPPARRSLLGWLKLAGFVAAAAILGGLGGWVAGRVAPAPEPADLSALEARLDALEQDAWPIVPDLERVLDSLDDRLTALEASGPADALRAEALEQLVRDAAGLAERVSALEEAGPGEGADEAALEALESRLREAEAASAERLDDLETRLAALAAGEAGDTADIAAALAPLQRRLGELDARIATVQSEAGAAPDLSALTSRLDAMAERIEAAERLARSASETAAGPAAPDHARRALAYTDLAEAAVRSGPFALELAELRRAWPGAPGVQRLNAHARNGAPSRERLIASFPETALRDASGETQVWFGVLRVARQSQAPGPADAARAALDEGDLAGAVSVIEALDGPAMEAAAEWLTGARARLDIEAAISALRDALQAEAGE
ncbi:hypothetical protein F1654_10810 [Alkalicaulis satelles]|uniref:Inner membrane protein n=1 Tax=Alkalicaulis satelles TaxID=2609175 RepID=A0A5M6ZC66_9PROT|nr:hypothetical protein [Alkalicaulis satelles]KAA5802312.1 hypothetical protein F1654_10810 [Alkalicaulis satelles]